jgi:hypothetical protein
VSARSRHPRASWVAANSLQPMVKTLPQMCRQCRNKRTGGRPIMPELGTFHKVAHRYDDWYWICHVCCPPHAGKRRNRPTKPSVHERIVTGALAASPYHFDPEYKMLCGEGRKPRVKRFDFAVPVLGLIVEVDSRHHKHRCEQDAFKTRCAEKAGWKVVRVAGEDLTGQVQAALALRHDEIYAQAREAPAADV